MRGRAFRGLLRGEGGFTLPEMMVTIMVMIVVLFSLYGIFDMSIRVFSVGNDKVEAVENARLGMERMERELRAAYPVDGANADGVFEPDAPQLFFDPLNPSSARMPSSPYDEITFGNDRDGDRRITCANSSTCEYITYKLSPDDPSKPDAPRTLQRVSSNVASDPGQPVIDFVRPDNATTTTVDEGLKFTLLDRNLNPAAAERDVRAVRIDLAVVVDGGNQQDGTQSLSTIVTLRNRAGVAPDASQPPPAPLATCNDGADNDNDGKKDFGPLPTNDPDCVSVTDASENPACSDEEDNDADAKKDYPADDGCRSASDPTETVDPQCSDGLDNDGDGKIDFGTAPTNDPGCTSATDNDETDPANRPPLAVADTATVQQGKSVTVPVIDGGTGGVGRDTDPDGDALTIQSFTNPAKGTVTRSGKTLVYAAGNGNAARGVVTFQYTISDGRGGTATARVTVTVT